MKRLLRNALFTAIFVLTASLASAAARLNPLTLHSFCSTGEPDCPDGVGLGGVVQGPDGAYYGTTAGGGANGLGVVYRITPAGRYSVLHDFDGSDGFAPLGGLTVGYDGFLYGTASGGGSGEASNGTVFRISTAGDFTVLYNFDYSDGSYPEGGNPQTPPVQTPQGDLYGTAPLGGSFDRGTIYGISDEGAFQKVYDFTGAADGSKPLAALVRASDGNLYGTTSMGNTIFRVTPGSTGIATMHVIDNPTEGSSPEAPLVEGPDGALYGTTFDAGPGGGGTVFRMDLDGEFTLLHAFQGSFYTGPKNTGLVSPADGYLYGVLPRGGTAHQGSIYRISLTGNYRTIYSFTGAGGGGMQPMSTLASGAGNTLFGTTIEGGEYGDGTVFRYKPRAP